jgi:hypothetical protein
MNTSHDDDTALNAALNAWQVPPPSPWLKTRTTQALIARHKLAERPSVWPFPPLRLAGLATAAALLGCIAGAALPPTTENEVAENEQVASAAATNAAPADEAELLVSELW